MVLPQSESKKHHFVPRSLLGYFRPAGDGNFLYAFDKSSGQAFRPSLMDAGSENHFNTIETDGGRVNFESDFEQVDFLLATRLREIHEARSISSLSEEHRRDWADLVAVQLVRTPIVRSTMTKVAEDLKISVAEMIGSELEIPVPSENDARRVARSLFADRAQMHQALANKDMVLFEACGVSPFRISDRPVTLESSLPFGDIGLASPGVAIFLPIGQRLMLGLLCPSIGRRLNKQPIEELDMHGDGRERLIALREGLTTGALVRLEEVMVRRHNVQQIANCKRFVYGPSDSFDDVREVIAANPETREVKSTIRLGRMGQGPAANPQMPMGAWLVLYGQSEQHMLEVFGGGAEEAFEVTVKETCALSAALGDGPFSEMQFFVDRHQIRGMRDVSVECRFNIAGCSLQVRHSDPSLDALMTMIGSRTS